MRISLLDPKQTLKCSHIVRPARDICRNSSCGEVGSDLRLVSLGTTRQTPPPRQPLSSPGHSTAPRHPWTDARCPGGWGDVNLARGARARRDLRRASSRGPSRRASRSRVRVSEDPDPLPGASRASVERRVRRHVSRRRRRRVRWLRRDPRAPRPRQRQAQPPEQDGASPQRHVRALRLPTRRAVSLRRDLRERVLPQARTRHRAGRRRHRRRRQHRPVRDVRRAEVSSGARVHARTPAPHVHQPPSQRSRKPRRLESRPGSTRGPGRRVTTRRYPRGVYILVR